MRAYGGPLACAAPFGAGLTAANLVFAGRPIVTLVPWALLDVFMLVPRCWRVVPREVRETLMQNVTTRLTAWRLGFQVP